VWNPVTSRLIMRISTQWIQYNPATDTYQTLSSAPGGDSAAGSTLFLDSAGGKVYRIEKRTAGTTPSIRMLDLHNLAAKEQTLLTEGDTGIEMLSRRRWRVRRRTQSPRMARPRTARGARSTP
jgi:hypothetical protein